MKQAWLFILILTSVAALGQSPPAGKSPKGAGPAFLDFWPLNRTAPTSGAAAAASGQQKPAVSNQTAEAKTPEPTSTGSAAAAFGIPSTNSASTLAPPNLGGYVPDDKYKLRVGDKIEIRGFGSFRTRQRKPRVGRNPKTGERVEVPAKKIPFFKPSKELKDLVNTAADVAPADRAGFVGEARGLWLWAVVWPERSGLLMYDELVLTDLRDAGAELEGDGGPIGGGGVGGLPRGVGVWGCGGVEQLCVGEGGWLVHRRSVWWARV